MFALPGAPTLFYGEEIGMAENLAVEDRLAVRTPMQWTGDAAAGFSAAPADGLVRPLPDDERFAPSAVNVRDQRTDPDSLLNWFERLIRLRKEAPEIGWGTCAVLPTAASVLALRHDWGGRSLFTVHNLGRRARRVELDLHRGESGELRDLLRREEPVPVVDGRATLTLAAHDHRWLRLDTTP
jgi:maltose alpha-D-glucosyltransferase/alpha-amylase